MRLALTVFGREVLAVELAICRHPDDGPAVLSVEGADIEVSDNAERPFGFYRPAEVEVAACPPPPRPRGS